MENNTANQGQTSNNNEINSQYKEALEKLKEEIEKTVAENQKDEFLG